MRMVLTPQEQSLLGEARKWAMEHWNPHSDAWETARQFPREAYAQAAADGHTDKHDGQLKPNREIHFHDAFDNWWYLCDLKVPETASAAGFRHL